MLEQIFGVPFTLLSFLIALSVVVFVHEFGHFFIARRCGVRCEVFSIGFGPELFGRTDRHGTRWKFSLIPLGGYVRMFGESDTMQAIEGGQEASEEGVRKLTPEEREVSFSNKTLGQRSAIVFAGPAVNILFAIAVFWGMFILVGQPVTKPIIGLVSENSAAADAGLMVDDKILAIDGSPIDRFEDIQNIVQIGNGAPLELLIERNLTEITVTLSPRSVDGTDPFGNSVRRHLIGISASGETRVTNLGPVSALGVAIGQTYEIIAGTAIAVSQMVSGERGAEDLGGPIKIAKYSGQAAKAGAAGFILFMAILSINLGIINLFPIPLLDGGHLVFYAIEALRGRPVSEQAQEWGMRAGLALVIALMVFVTWNDIVHF